MLMSWAIAMIMAIAGNMLVKNPSDTWKALGAMSLVGSCILSVLNVVLFLM